jgi:hypothetical protein
MSSIKVTQTPNFTPTIEQLNVGDLLINSYDGNVFIKQQQNKIQNIINLRSTGSIVTKIIAGSNITVSPSNGTGVVTINATTPISASYALSASYAVTSSYSLNGAPKGPNYSIQYNNGGLFSGSSNFTLLNNNSLYLTGSLNVSGSTLQIGNNTLVGNTLLSGSIIISGSTTPGNPTASVQIYGDIRQTGYHRFDPVTTNIVQSTSASYIYVSGSTNDLYFSQNSAGYSNTTRLRWIEGNMYTGLLSGGVLSSTPGSTTFNLSSGSGIIVTLNATTASADPYPTIQYLSWGNFVSQSITNRNSAKITYISVNSAGTINQSVNPVGYTDPTQWDNQIEIGVVLHLSGSVSTGVYNAPQVAYGVAQRTDDFIRAFGPVKISGHILQTSGSTLGLTKTAGVSYNNGANYVINPNHPSTVTDTAVNVSKIYRYYVSGSTPVIDTGILNAGYTSIDPTKYVNTTTGNLASVPGGRFTIQRVFWIPNSPTNAFLVYYGNDTYNSSDTAVTAIQTEPFSEAPNTAQNAILVGYVIVDGGASNLNNATIVQGGLFRSINGVGASGTSPTSNTLAGLSDVSIDTKTTGDLFFFSGSLWYNTKQLSGSYGITGSLNATSLTGSLLGTSSWALNSISSSYALTASYWSGSITSTISASYAATSSFPWFQTGSNIAYVGGNVGIAETNPKSRFTIQTPAGGYWISMDRGNTTEGGNTPTWAVLNNTDPANATYGWAWYDSGNDGSFSLWRRSNSTTANLVVKFDRNNSNTYFAANVIITGSATNSLTVKGSGTTSATTGFRVENSSATGLFVVRNDGFVGIGTTGPSDNLTVMGSTALYGGQTTITGATSGSGTSLLVRNLAGTSALIITNARSSSFNGNVDISGDLTANQTASMRRFQSGYFMDLHPESGNNSILPFYSNDIAYNTLRGGTFTASFGSGSTYTLATSQVEAMFDGSPNYNVMNAVALSGSMTASITFPQNYNFGNIIGFSFGSYSWVAKDFTVEILVTGSYSTLDTQTNYQYANYSKEFNVSGNALQGMRITFSNFVSPTSTSGFRIAQIFLLNFNGTLGKAVFLGRDGGAVYKPITVQSGSTSGPSYASLTNTNTGMYFPTTNAIGFVNNGTENIRLDSTGKLSIGKTTANSTLDVLGNLIITGSTISTLGFTGSLQGTSSWASNSISSSYSTTASYWSGSILNATSASYALSASYWSGSILNATSASFASTASYWSGSILNATSASYALSASYAPSTPFPYTGTAGITGSLAIRGADVSSATKAFHVQTGNGTSIMDFRNATYAFFGCGQGGGSASGFIFRYDNPSAVQFCGYNYGAGAGSYKPILMDTDIGGRNQGIFVNYSASQQPASTEFGVKGQGATSATFTAKFQNSNLGDILTIRDDGNVTITGSLTAGNSTGTPSTENTLNVYPPPAGGTGEGGQILLAAVGGTYTSASMLDTWQDQFRILRGSNTGGSNAGLLYMNLQTGNTQFTGAVTASAYSGLPNNYLYVTRNTNQTIVSGNWANRDIIFNNTVYSNGIAYNTVSGLASLTAGKVYRITSRVAWQASAAYTFEISCYDSTNVQLGPAAQQLGPANGSFNSSEGTVDFIYAPSVNTDIKIRTTANTLALTGEQVRGDLNTQLIIQQIA